MYVEGIVGIKSAWDKTEDVRLQEERQMRKGRRKADKKRVEERQIRKDRRMIKERRNRKDNRYGREV